MANYLIDRLYEQADTYHDREFCSFKAPGETVWRTFTWADFIHATERAACALMALGAAEASKAALCTPNRPEALQVEFACFFHRICGVPIYAYCSQEQFDYIMLHSGARIIFAGAREQYEMARCFAEAHPQAVDQIVLLCERAGVADAEDATTLGWSEFLAKGNSALLADVKARASQGTPQDLASLIYTSGTTGEPKGVMLTHGNFEAAVREHLKRLPEIEEHELSLCFLPMSHVFEKAWTFFCMAKGLRIAFNYDPRDIERSLHEVHPNLMCCVPRFWEKIYTGIIHRISRMNPLARLMVHRAMRVGARMNLHYKRLGLRAPWLLRKEYAFWDRKLFSQVRETIGIPSPNFFPTAGAALSDKICGTMRKMGIDLIFGYGMTETTATVSCYPHTDYEIGTVGTPMPMVEVKISDDGEILVKGPTVTPGYYENPAANAEAFTADGYQHTGDAGFMNQQGALVLTHRKKDMFKTSNGKYISPQATEALLVADPYIDQVAVIGDARKYVSALVVPNFSTLRSWAEKQGIIDFRSESLCRNERVIEFYLSRIKQDQKGMAPFETVKRVTLLPNPFTMESGEITNTLKLRRNVIAERYAKEINAMYPEEFLTTPPVFNTRHR